jgi:antitoxin component YwqK of YwqJK toxin-antitoxin module
MSDLAKWKVHGQVRSVKTSFAEWDLAAEEWCGPRYHNEAIFRPDGKLDETRHFNPDGTIARTKNLYDEGGLLIETQFWKDDSLQNQTFYTYDEARRHVRTVSLTHDGKEREAETSTYDRRGWKTTVRFLYQGI